jgi:hypothetical protein
VKQVRFQRLELQFLFFAGGAAAFAGVDGGCEGVIELADLLF